MDTRTSLFVFGLFALVVWFAWATSSDGICSSEYIQGVLKDHTKDGALNCFDFWLNRYQTLIGSIVAIGAAWYAGRWVSKQVNLTNEQIKVAKEANVSEYRAYVRIDIDKARIVPGKSLYMMAKAVNYGRTPAYDYWAQMELKWHAPGWKWPAQTELRAEGPPTKAVVHSGAQTDIEVDSKIPLSEELIENIRSGKLTAFLRITTQYKDAFGFDRQTQEALEFSGAACIDNQRPRYSKSGTIFT